MAIMNKEYKIMDKLTLISILDDCVEGRDGNPIVHPGKEVCDGWFV